MPTRPPFANRAHAAVYRAGQDAALAGRAREAPYSIDTPASLRCRQIWLAGFDEIAPPSSLTNSPKAKSLEEAHDSTN